MNTSSRRAAPATGWRAVIQWAWRLAVLIPLLVIAAAVMFVVGVAGHRFGWLTAPLLLAGGGGGLAWILFIRHPRRQSVSLAAAATGLALALLLWMATPVMPSRLAGAISSVDLPPGTALVEAREFGNALCFDYCPSLIHRYEVPGTAREVERSLADAFRSDGWSVTPSRHVPRAFTAVSRDATIEADVTVAPEFAVEQEEPDNQQLPDVRPGHVLVEANIAENPCPPGEPGC